MSYAEINAAIQGMKVLYEIVKANKGLTEYNELISTVAEVNTKLFDAQQMVFAVLQDRDALANRVRELEKKIRTPMGDAACYFAI